MDLPDESIQCVITSPPYWGLRKYDGCPDLVWGGKDDCRHVWGDELKKNVGNLGNNLDTLAGTQTAIYAKKANSQGYYCQLCGAWRGQFGLEPTIELYVEHTLVFLKEIWRVLRKDGTVFWNIGDSYAGGGNNRGNNSPISDKQASNYGAVGQCAEHQKNIKLDGIKPKDLCLIPFRVALAAQAQGWWVRSDIIWNKPNPMPESVQDRPTNSYEHIFLFTKSARYYWDMEAVREPQQPESLERLKRGWNGNGERGYPTGPQKHLQKYFNKSDDEIESIGGRNLRDVWTFPTKGYSGAHFAVFPPELPERCIKAGTPEYGCCDKCGKPYERIVEHKNMIINHSSRDNGTRIATSGTMVSSPETKTLGWQQGCKCENSNPVPSTVLDPFCGSGTTLLVAAKLDRKAIGYELSSKYTELIIERNRQSVL
jgi:DNA modification methylase